LWKVFDVSTNPIVLFDEERLCVDTNPALCELLGRPHDDIVGLKLDDFMTPQARSTMIAEWSDQWTTGGWDRDSEVIRSDGTVIRVQCAMRTGDVPGHHLGVAVMLAMPVDDVPPGSGTPEALTPRESEVVKLVALGRTSPEIAEELVISTATARTHVANAMAKTGARTRAQLVATALANRKVAGF